MKRIISAALLLCLLVAMTGCLDIRDPLIWKYEDHVLTLRSRENTHVEALWFREDWEPYRDEIKTVIIGPGIEGLGDYAFQDLPALTTVKFQGELSYIGSCAFQGTALVLESLPPTLTYIGEEAFEGCVLPQTFVIPKSVNTIQAGAFANTSGMETLIFEGPSECRPGGLGAFESSADLKEAVLAEGTGWLCSGLFRNCKKMTSVAVPETLNWVGISCFEGCTALTSIRLPDAVKYIDERAFASCTALREIHIPENLDKLLEQAFLDCTALTEIKIPSGTTQIMESSFEGCTSLTRFSVSPENEHYASDEMGLIYDKSMTTLLLVPPGMTGTLTLPDHITAIGVSCFRDSHLTEVILPDSIRSLDHGAFAESNIRRVNIPASVESLGCNLFTFCDSLEEIAYEGTQDQWNALPNSDHNTELLGQFLHFAPQE